MPRNLTYAVGWVCLVGALLLSNVAGQTLPSAPNQTGASGPGESASSPSSSYPPGHKHLAPVDADDIGMFIVIGVALFIASGAGVGGGVLVVPALLIIGHFNTIVAVALSNITILASAVANMIFNIPRRSPLRLGPLIDWDLVLLLGPPTVVGSIAGSYINMVIPSWVTKITLFLLVLPMTWRMIKKARSLFKRETAEKTAARAAIAAEFAPERDRRRVKKYVAAEEVPAAVVQLRRNISAAGTAAAAGPAGASEVTAGAMGPRGGDVEQGGQSVHDAPGAAAVAVRQPSAAAVEGSGAQASVTPAPAPNPQPAGPAAAAPVKLSCWQQPPPEGLHTCSHHPNLCSSALSKIQKEEAAQLPLLQVGLLILILAVVAVTNVTGGFLLTCGSWQWWLLMLSPLPMMAIVWWVTRYHVLWKAGWKKCLGVVEGGDLKWDRRTTVVYPAVCISAGVIAGMLGLGGGLVLTPLMLELGVYPAVSVASTQVTLLISSSTSAIVYAVNDSIPWDYGTSLIIIGFITTLLGQWIISWGVRRLGRSSILVVILALMFCLASGATLAVVVMTIIDVVQHPGKLTARKEVCPTFD